MEVIKTRLKVLRITEVLRTRWDVMRTSHFPGGRTHGRDQESGRVGDGGVPLEPTL